MTLPPTTNLDTEPVSELAAPAPLPPAPLPVRFPITWLLEHASTAIRYRALADVAEVDFTADQRSAAFPYTYRPALLLALSQGLDGTWSHTMLTVPSPRAAHFEGVGTINAVRRLLEYGWDKDSPPLLQARRILFRLLAEDDDPEFLFEFGGKAAPDDDLVHRGRAILREAAAAALAQAGYQGDPRLRGAARRILDRINDFLRSPLAEKPWMRVGNQHVLAPEAAPPSIHALTMLAYMPLFCTEHAEVMDRIYAWVSQAQPRQEIVQLLGRRIATQAHLVMGDQLPHRNAADADVARALVWLELMARLGFLKLNENWSRLFDRFLDDRDADAVWHPHKGMQAVKTVNPFVWPMFPLEQELAGDERWTDVTFRLGLIARLAGRPIDLV
ncbi:MAG: hypothetical protein KGN74_05455 [Gemmatimonadota bacterium]|nr:hypothetical protein [Gemmatimonadota bacterium]